MLPVDKGLNLEKHADEIGPAHVCSKHNRVICRYMCAFAVMEIILAGSLRHVNVGPRVFCIFVLAPGGSAKTKRVRSVHS